MRIAISGAGGFIGGALTTELRSLGHEIHPIVRHAPRPGEIGIDLVSRTMDCSNISGGNIGAVDVIYHLAGEPLSVGRMSGKKREAIRSSRIASTHLIAREIASAPVAPRTFISMSAVGYYGDRGEEILTEQSGIGVGFLADVCGAWEAAAAPAREIGVQTIQTRAGVVIGNGGGMMRILRPLFSMGLGGNLGSGSQFTSVIALADTVKALVYLADNDKFEGPCNLTSPNPVTNAQFTKALGLLLHRPTPFAVPAPLLRLALGAQSANEMVLGSTRALPDKLLNSGFIFDFPSIDEILRNTL